MARIDATLEQWADGPAPDARTPADHWVAAGLDANQAHYTEGGFVPFRLVIEGATVGTTYAVTIEWDTTLKGLQALDALATLDRSFPIDRNETIPEALTGLTGVAPGTLSFPDIPADLRVAAGADRVLGTADDVALPGGNFQVFGGITDFRFVDLGNDNAIGGSGSGADQVLTTDPYHYGGSFRGNSSTALTLEFTYTGAAGAPTGQQGTVVLGWSAHIATRADWGSAATVAALKGTPFHLRLVNVTDTDPASSDSGTAADLTLTAAAVVYPATIVVTPETTPGGSSQPFNFEFVRPANSADVVAGQLDLSGDGLIDAEDSGRFADSGGEVFAVVSGQLTDLAGGDGTVDGFALSDGFLGPDTIPGRFIDITGGGAIDSSDAFTNLAGTATTTFTLTDGQPRVFDRLTDFAPHVVREVGIAPGWDLASVGIQRTDIGNSTTSSVVNNPPADQVSVSPGEGQIIELSFNDVLVGVPSWAGAHMLLP